MHPDFEEEIRRLWQAYHRARETSEVDLDALLREVRAMRTQARRAAFTVHAQQLDDLANYVARERATRKRPEDRLRDLWPALVPEAIEQAIAEAERALASKRATAIRRAIQRLQFVDRPEHLADIAEEGIAGELAPLIPGARVDQGMLVLSAEHDALIERGRQWLARLNQAR